MTACVAQEVPDWEADLRRRPWISGKRMILPMKAVAVKTRSQASPEGAWWTLHRCETGSVFLFLKFL